MQLNFDVVVIGAGSAGMTAAINLKRANLNVVMIEEEAPGGQINKTDFIENYPGFFRIEGPTLAYNMFEQTQKLEIPYYSGKVLTVIDKGDYKIVKTKEEEITCLGVIIASGRRPRHLGLPKEEQLKGQGISWCAICDGAFFKGKEVVVVGGGNSALEGALYLSEIAKKVTLIHRRDTFRGDKILQEKVLNNKVITIKYNSEIEEIEETNGLLKGIKINNNLTKEKQRIKVDGLFIYIGFEPVSDFIIDKKIKDENNYLIVDQNMRTNRKLIYACGDVIKKELYQVTTAIGEGAKAAHSLIQDLQRKTS